MCNLLVYHLVDFRQLGQSDEMWVELQEVRGKVTLYSKQLEQEEQAMEDVSHQSTAKVHVTCVSI